MLNHTLLDRPKPVLLVGVLLAVLAALGLTGCGSDSTKPSGSSGSTRSSASPTSNQSAGQKLAITVKGNTVTPTNKRIPVKLNVPLAITITSDRSGELHVHSSPEQHIEFGSGTTTRTITLKVPGLIELEEHTSDTLIAQLEVR